MGALNVSAAYSEFKEALATEAPEYLPYDKPIRLIVSFDVEDAGSLLTKPWSGYTVEKTNDGIIYRDCFGDIVDKDIAMGATRPGPRYTEEGWLIPPLSSQCPIEEDIVKQRKPYPELSYSLTTQAAGVSKPTGNNPQRAGTHRPLSGSDLWY